RPEYGEALQEMSDYILDKGRKRQKLWALYRKFREEDPAKARRIKRHNLGFAKQREKHRKFRRRCENEINRAFNELFRLRSPKVIAYEDLSHLRGKAKSKGLSRKVSLWMRRITKERLEYKSYIYSVADPGPVNVAYASQECPVCHWVDPRNRDGDIFKCRRCGFTADADQVNAINVKNRLHDEEITKHTPYRKVKEVLLRRHYERNAIKA
ncbi:MAG: zinc ribbon domain-containing protein, partial [Desulfofundulus sp.]